MNKELEKKNHAILRKAILAKVYELWMDDTVGMSAENLMMVTPSTGFHWDGSVAAQRAAYRAAFLKALRSVQYRIAKAYHFEIINGVPDAFKSCKATLSLLNRRDRKALEIFRAAIFYGMPLADAWRLVETDELNAALANEVDSRRVSQ